MKRMAGLLLLLVMTVTISACGNSDDSIKEEIQETAVFEEQDTSASIEEMPVTEGEGTSEVESEQETIQQSEAVSPSTKVTEPETPSAPVESTEPEITKPSETLQTPEKSPENNHGEQIDSMDSQGETEENTEVKLTVQVGDTAFLATLEDNAAVDAFIDMMEQAPVVIEMSDYSGFEKVGSLGTSLPDSNSQITTSAGDIVLYNGNQIVIFYGSNSWSYTRLGKIDDLSGWEDALGSGDVTVTFSIGG